MTSCITRYGPDFFISTSFLKQEAGLMGRFRYWLLGDIIQKDGATMLITGSQPPSIVERLNNAGLSSDTQCGLFGWIYPE
jgi:hypothetical protein